MKVYLLIADDGSRFFYAEPPENRERRGPSTRPGIRGWMERKAETLRSAWKNADGGLAGRMRQAWEWLLRRTPADESMLVQLKTARRIEIHHPASHTEEEVRLLWAEYLTSRKRRHLPRFGTTAAITPLTVLLAPLPGPNLVGYWFMYRTWRHLGVLLGVRRAGSDRVTIAFLPTEALDRPIRENDDALAALPLRGPSRTRLVEFLHRSGPGLAVQTAPASFSLAGNSTSD